MGIPGLSSFVSRNSDLTRPYRLHSQKIIVDGIALLYHLYGLTRTDIPHDKFGGDYISLYKTVCKFFEAMQQCKVEPIVVLDGGLDGSKRRIDTIIKRSQRRLDNCNEAAKGKFSSDLVLPILSEPCFKDILRELGVKFVQSLADADMPAVSLASYYQAPVVSNDSDFFVFNINAGFIKLESIDYNNVLQLTDKHGTKNYLDCILYKVDYLLEYFPGLNREILPLFSTLMGNDFVDTEFFEEIIDSLPDVTSDLIANRRQKSMIKLLHWMQYKTKEECTNFVLKSFTAENRQLAASVIQSSQREFKNKTDISVMLQILNGDTKVFGNSGDTFVSEKAPSWFLHKHMIGDLDTKLIDIYLARKIFLKPQVNDLRLPSAYTAPYPIKNFLYSLFLFDSPHNLEIYDREGTEYKKTVIKLDADDLHISLNSYVEMTIHERQEILLKLVESSCDEWDELNSELKTFNLKPNGELSTLVLLLKFWKTHGICKFRESLIAILISTLFYYLVNDSDRLPGLSEKEKITIRSNISQFEHRPGVDCPSTLKVWMIHSFNEVQAIVFFFNMVQSIADCVFLSISPRQFFQGTTIYNLGEEIMRRPLFNVNSLFGRQSILSKLFVSIMKFIEGTEPLPRNGKGISQRILDDI